jgi:hypothetical protein
VEQRDEVIVVDAGTNGNERGDRNDEQQRQQRNTPACNQQSSAVDQPDRSCAERNAEEPKYPDGEGGIP